MILKLNRIMFTVCCVSIAILIASCINDSEKSADVTQSLMWIEKPAGLQCQTSPIVSFDAMIQELTQGSIEIMKSREINHIVASVCGGPTSLHYQVQIHGEDVDEAFELEWKKITQN